MNWDSFPTIKAERVYLRWITHDDVDSLYRIFSHPEVMRYWGAPALADRDAAIALVNEIHDAFERRASMKWGIALRTDNTLIGTATLFNLNLDNRRAEVGYGLERAQWGKGYMQETLRALLSYAFDERGLHRLEADVDPRNAASIRTLERLGFQREGFLRERWHVNGEIQDAFFYGLLKPEWEAGNRRQNAGVRGRK
jgi:ribosomal-protein-alanine N-acetyltransferase